MHVRLRIDAIAAGAPVGGRDQTRRFVVPDGLGGNPDALAASPMFMAALRLLAVGRLNNLLLTGKVKRQRSGLGPLPNASQPIETCGEFCAKVFPPRSMFGLQDLAQSGGQGGAL